MFHTQCHELIVDTVRIKNMFSRPNRKHTKDAACHDNLYLQKKTLANHSYSSTDSDSVENIFIVYNSFSTVLLKQGLTTIADSFLHIQI